MRRIVLALLALAVAAPATASAATTVVFRTAPFTYAETVSHCGFPLTVTGTAEHWLRYRYEDLPEGFGPGVPGVQLYQRAGSHHADYRETWTNPANGRTLDLHGTDRLTRSDFSFDGAVDPVTHRLTGTLTSQVSLSYAWIATAPSEGLVLQDAGRLAYVERSQLANSVETGRTRSLLHLSGPYRDAFCTYLAG